MGIYKGRIFAGKDCIGSEMVEITREIKKDLKVVDTLYMTNLCIIHIVNRACQMQIQNGQIA